MCPPSMSAGLLRGESARFRARTGFAPNRDMRRQSRSQKLQRVLDVKMNSLWSRMPGRLTLSRLVHPGSRRHLIDLACLLSAASRCISCAISCRRRPRFSKASVSDADPWDLLRESPLRWTLATGNIFRCGANAASSSSRLLRPQRYPPRMSLQRSQWDAAAGAWWCRSRTLRQHRHHALRHAWLLPRRSREHLRRHTSSERLTGRFCDLIARSFQH